MMNWNTFALSLLLFFVVSKATTEPGDYKALRDQVLVVHIDRLGAQGNRVNGLQTTDPGHQILNYFYGEGYVLEALVAPSHIHTVILVKRTGMSSCPHHE